MLNRIVMTAAFLAASSVVLAQTQASSPERPAKAGDVHVYKGEARHEGKSFEETVTVVSADAEFIRTRHVRTDRPETGEGIYGRDWATTKSGSSGMQMDPPSKTLQMPLAVGKTWEAGYMGTTATGFKIRVKVDSTVAAQERLKTPAGEFDTWRVESRGYINPASGPGGWAIVQKVWYAPAIDRIVRLEYREQRSLGVDSIVELKEFRPAP
ncbi:MAG: hypothetical protein Q8R63_08330 [Ramlibacter sp.]|nr:hypothetical protein [Ramlibacter sp.]